MQYLVRRCFFCLPNTMKGIPLLEYQRPDQPQRPQRLAGWPLPPCRLRAGRKVWLIAGSSAGAFTRTFGGSFARSFAGAFAGAFARTFASSFAGAGTLSLAGALVRLLASLMLWLAGCTGVLANTLPPAAADFAMTEPQFGKVGDEQAIPEGAVTALAQDARGLIWIGTVYGLVRYDGYRFRKFNWQASDRFSLAGDFVSALWPAPDGRLWIGTNSSGLSVFDPATERFENFQHDPNVASSLGGGRISALAGDAQGGMWIATDQGLSFLPRAAKSFRHLRQQATASGSASRSLLSDKVRSLLLDQHGRLWVGSSNGLQRLATDGKQFETLLEGKNIQSLLLAQDGKLWIGTADHGAAWLMPDAPSVHFLPLAQLSHPWIKSMAQVSPQQIWLGTGLGIQIVAASDGQPLQQLRHDAARPDSLAQDSVKTMLRDRAGWLWLGTWGGGLQRTNATNSMLRVLRHSPNQPPGLSHPDIKSLLELADGRLLFGSAGNGIDIFDRQRGLTGGYRKATPTTPGTLPDGTIQALAQTPDGTVWAGTQQAGALRQIGGADKWESVPGLPSQNVKRFLLSRNGTLWVGTDRGLARWRAGDTQFATIPEQPGKPMRNAVGALAEDWHGRIWVGTDNGLWLHEPESTGMMALPAAPGRADGLISNDITGLLCDAQGRIWVNTDKGLERLLQLTGRQAQFEHMSALLGQPGKQFSGDLMQDRAGRIWSNDAVIDPDKLRFQPLAQADGMNIGTTWRGAFTQTRDGLLLFGGQQGVAIINPELFRQDQDAAPTVVVALKINGHSTAPGTLALPPGESAANTSPHAILTLKPEQRDFLLEFAMLDYAAPKQNRYQYRLLGYDEDWKNTDFEHRSAGYGNLWPGEYTLVVRGSNRFGVWSPQELTIQVRVLPAFWQTGWFLLLCLVLTALIMLAAFRWRLARLRKRGHAMQKMIDTHTSDILKLGEIGRELTATLDTEQAFQRIYNQVITRLDAEVFLIGVVNAAHIDLLYCMEKGQRLPKIRMNMSEFNRPAVWCVREQRELLVHRRADLLNFVDHLLQPSAGKEMETILYLPLLAGQSVIGCLSVQSPRQNAYNPNQLEFLRILASYLAIAVANSAAHTELAESHEELADALRYLKETQAKLIQAERQQLSLDLHDNLSQTMTGVLLQLDTARDAVLQTEAASVPASSLLPAASPPPVLPYLERAIELARDGITQTRHLLNQLRNQKNKPPPMKLIDALRRDLPRLTVGTAIKVSVEQMGRSFALAATVELALFRIAQEAVTNALRHGGAQYILVSLEFQFEAVVLSISDDGKGFATGDPACTPGIGLMGMQERITALAGRLEIDSSPGSGTRITATLPASQAGTMTDE